MVVADAIRFIQRVKSELHHKQVKPLLQQHGIRHTIYFHSIFFAKMLKKTCGRLETTFSVCGQGIIHSVAYATPSSIRDLILLFSSFHPCDFPHCFFFFLFRHLVGRSFTLTSHTLRCIWFVCLVIRTIYLKQVKSNNERSQFILYYIG